MNFWGGQQTAPGLGFNIKAQRKTLTPGFASRPRPVTSTPLLWPNSPFSITPATVPAAARRISSSRTTSTRSRRSSEKRQIHVEPTPEPNFLASEEQQRAIDLALAGENIFLTGCAGTGKSATLNEVRRKLRAKHGSKAEYEKRVAVVAMTGLAATIVGGTTLHTLLKLRRVETFRDLEHMQTDGNVQDLLAHLETLVLDEAGMLSAELLQALDGALTVARKKAVEALARRQGAEQAEIDARVAACDRPFGGLQLILSGDFFQLAPIANKAAGGTGAGGVGRDGVYAPGRGSSRDSAVTQPFLNRGIAFQAPVFQYGGFELVELTKVFRQDEQEFVSLLNGIRCATDAECDAALQALAGHCSEPNDESDGIKSTHLYSRNDMVGSRNEEELSRLPGKEERFTSVDEVHVTHEPPFGVYDPLVSEKLLPRPQHAAFLQDLERSAGHKHLDAIKQLPPPARDRARELRDKWRREVSRHLKSVAEGAGGLYRECQAGREMTLKIDAQVMLVRNLDLEAGRVNGSRGVVTGWTSSDNVRAASLAMARGMDVECAKEVAEWFDANELVPLVRFTGSREAVPIGPAVFSALVPGYGTCMRVQCPLKLAWAITVHKAQGMSLDKVSTDLAGYFGHGMLYTALSRARSLKGLHITGRTRRKMDPRVMRWWADLRAGRPHDGREVLGPNEPAWCWDSKQQPLTGRPQNALAREWFDSPEAFWQRHGAPAAVGVGAQGAGEARGPTSPQGLQGQAAPSAGQPAASLPAGVGPARAGLAPTAPQQPQQPRQQPAPAPLQASQGSAAMSPLPASSPAAPAAAAPPGAHPPGAALAAGPPASGPQQRPASAAPASMSPPSAPGPARPPSEGPQQPGPQSQPAAAPTAPSQPATPATPATPRRSFYQAPASFYQPQPTAPPGPQPPAAVAAPQQAPQGPPPTVAAPLWRAVAAPQQAPQQAPQGPPPAAQQPAASPVFAASPAVQQPSAAPSTAAPAAQPSPPSSSPPEPSAKELRWRPAQATAAPSRGAPPPRGQPSRGLAPAGQQGTSGSGSDSDGDGGGGARRAGLARLAARARAQHAGLQARLAAGGGAVREEDVALLELLRDVERLGDSEDE